MRGECSNMQICKKMAISCMTAILMLPISLGTNQTTAKASYLGDSYYVSKTKFSKNMVGTYRAQYYDSAKALHAKHGLMTTIKVRLTRSGKGSYFKSWTGTKKGQLSHPIKQKFRSVYKTKEKGVYALIPAGKHKKNKYYISLIDTTQLKLPKIQFIMRYGNKSSGPEVVSKNTNLTF